MRSKQSKMLTALLLIAVVALSGCQEAREKNVSAGQIDPPKKTERIIVDAKPVVQPDAKPVVQPDAKPVVQPDSKPIVQPDAKPVVKPESDDQQQASSPELKIESSVHDFGKVSPNNQYNTSFKFTNTGQDTLKITKVTSTCGCTVPDLKKKEYAPGESGEILVKYRSPSYSGQVTKHLFILSNDPRKNRAELTIKATVELKVSFEPQKLSLSMKDSVENIPPITLKSTDGKTFSIMSISCTGSAISAEFDPEAKAKEFVLQPKADIEKLKKWPDGSISVALSHPETKRLTIAYQTQPCIEISQQRIILQNAEPGLSVERNVLVKNNCDDDFEIESITSSKGHMEVLSQTRDDNAYKLQIQVTPPQRVAKVQRYITDKLTIKFKDGSTGTIHMSGWYKPQ